ncbi:MAG: hypothetical protein ACM3PV_03270 [Betaproteobacteria bacterium]|jgi:hypothetical protein
MRGIVFLVELLLWLLIIRIVLRGLARLFAPATQRRAASAGPAARQVEDLVLDRVCRTYVPRSRAVAARVAGHEELFCSAACRDKALAAVARAS